MRVLGFFTILFITSTAHSFIMSKAGPVKAKASNQPQYYGQFAMFFHGLHNSPEELLEELKNEIVFPEGSRMTVQEVFSWSLSRIPTLETILAAHGYYDAEVDFFVDVRSTPPIIYWNIKPGKLFTIGAFSIRADPPHRGPVALMAQDIAQFGVKLGMPANKYKVQEVKDAILAKLGESGYPFARITGERIVLNRSKKRMLVAFRVRANKFVRYGNIYLEGDSDITPEFLKRFIDWEKGDRYNKALVERTAQQIMDTGAFKDVMIYLDRNGKNLADLTPEEIENEDDAPSVMIDLYFHLIPRSSSLIRLKGALGVEDAVGFEGVRFNRLQKGETFRLHTCFSPLRSIIAPRILVPNLFGYMRLQSISGLALGTEKYPGFSTANVELSQAFDYTINKNFGLTFGVGVEYCRYPELHRNLENFVKANSSWDAFAGVVFNNLDNPITPTQGWRIKLLGQASMGIHGFAYKMSRIKTSAHLFVPINKSRRLVWENWVKAFFTPSHTNLSPQNDISWDIPIHRLLYVGGPRGVRGYRRQPFSNPPADLSIDAHYSMIILGSQMRYALNRHFSVAAFVDVGDTFSQGYPTITWPMHYSVGGSARIVTRYGALDFSMSTPLYDTPYASSVEYTLSFTPIWSVE